ncbi:MAG TPA: DUF1566 domain-containing protein [Sulfurovum sp.]|nr:DUF1566 domain-containing protein [Sulfurovum sp.]
MKQYITVIIMLIYTQIYAQNTITFGKTMYQNKAFTTKDKRIFDADKEGSRVWRWSKAQNYCKDLKLDAYDDWRVASQKELQAIMTKKPSAKGLFVRSTFASTMPATGGKYDNVWMWTRDSKSSKLGAFVNFKKAKSGKADKSYKGYVLCTRNAKVTANTTKKTTCKGNSRQELTYSRDWVKAWNTCSGYTALKKDGSLWQFGKVGECGWGKITPFDPQTGKAIYKEKTIYTLKPKKIGSGFTGAKIINGGYRLYAIKRDGTLWGWGEGLGTVPRKLSKSHKWLDFGIRYAGNGCCGYDVGLRKDGTLWRFPEFFDYTKKGSVPKLKKISRFNDWKKVVLGCCAIYGLRKDGPPWKSFEEQGKTVFKRHKLKKKSYDGDMDLYPFLTSKMAKVQAGTIYSPSSNIIKIKVKKDGTLCLLPMKE